MSQGLLMNYKGSNKEVKMLCGVWIKRGKGGQTPTLYMCVHVSLVCQTRWSTLLCYFLKCRT